MTRPALWIAAAALAFTSAGCASFTAKRARARYLDAELQTLRYAQPIEQVWGELTRLLKEERFPVMEKEGPGGLQGFVVGLFSPARPTSVTPKGVWTLDTDWRRDDSRIHAAASPGEGGTQVVLTRITRDRTNYGTDESRRDLELELALARRLAPEQAARIEGGIPK
jgi:hypothetical protein